MREDASRPAEGEERRLSVQFSPRVGKTVGKLSRIDRARNKGVKIIALLYSAWYKRKKVFCLASVPLGKTVCFLDGGKVGKWFMVSWGCDCICGEGGEGGEVFG